MTRRVLVCIQDTGVARVVVARLQTDGIDGVVVDGPGQLVDTAKGDADALVVQDRYPSGEAGSSLLRQMRVARGAAVPAVYLMTQELAAPDRHVLEKQYKVGAFLKFEATPHSIASALLEAAGGEEPDVVLHEDEMSHAFDIEVATLSQLEQDPFGALDELEHDGGFEEHAATVEVDKVDHDAVRATRHSRFPALGGSLGADDGDEDGVTGETSATELMGVQQLHQLASAAPPDVTSEGEGVSEPDSAREILRALDGITLDGLFDQPSELPVPGGEDDFQFREPIFPVGPSAAAPPEPEPDDALMLALLDPLDDDNEAEAAIAEALAATVEASIEPHEFETLNLEHLAEEISDEAPRGDDMEINDLKKGLLAQKKAREAAEKRVKELETRLTRLEPAPSGSGEGGVPAEGVFEDLRYPKLLALCRAEGFTGAVLLQIGGNTRTVFLRDGLPISYASSEPGERIGRMMVEQKRITDEQYIKAATVMVERGIKLTEALVELGFIEGETLAVEMRNLTRDQIILGFELTQGRFTTQRGKEHDSGTVPFDFGPGEIYVQGYRQYAPKQEMQALFETLRDRYLIANERLQAFRPKLGLNSDDERLLRLLGEAYTLEEAVERAAVTPEHAARLVAALQALGLVEEWSPGVEQFRARLRAEREQHAEQVASLREQMSKREQRLFEGFERALSKISSATGGSVVKLSDHVDGAAKAEASSGGLGLSSSAPPAGGLSSFSGEQTIKAEAPQPAQAAPSGAASSQVTSLPPPPKAEPKEPAAPKNPFGTPPKGDAPADKKYRDGLEQAMGNRLDEAEVTLRDAVRMDASRPEYLLSLARVLLANPRYERAGTLPVVRSLLDRAVQIAPDNGEVKELHKQVVGEMGS
jgi:hypothetical protein